LSKAASRTLFAPVGIARHVIADRLAHAPIEQREYRALRIGAVEDPGAARHFHWAIEDFAAAGLDAPGRRLDVGNVEIIKPPDRR
jgi:hypothetical protein